MDASTGAYTVTLVNNFKGNTKFTWKITSNQAVSNIATVNIRVAAVADGITFVSLGNPEYMNIYEDSYGPFRFGYTLLDSTEFQRFYLDGIPTGCTPPFTTGPMR